MTKNLPLKQYLFRERMVRAILKEWREKMVRIYLRGICYKYDLPYFRSRSFLSRLVRDRMVVIERPPDVLQPQIVFSLTSDGLEKLKNELLYASTV